MLHVGIVEIISDQRITGIFHMDTDLMGAARLQDEGDEAVPVFCIQHPVMCDGMFPVFKINLPLDQWSGRWGH